LVKQLLEFHSDINRYQHINEKQKQRIDDILSEAHRKEDEVPSKVCNLTLDEKQLEEIRRYDEIETPS
jgi:hypothetical protein